jgi:hypothetical protein
LGCGMEQNSSLSDPPIGGRVNGIYTITTETPTTVWIGKFCLTLMREDVVDADVCFSSSSLDLQGECEGDNDDSKDNKGDEGSKHRKHSKECKASEDNEGRKGRTIPHKKGQVDASLDVQC